MDANSRLEPLWRWLSLSVCGAALPFAILAFVYLLVVGHHLPLRNGLQHGELFVPASVMNVEAILTFRHVRMPLRGLWLPPVAGLCGLASAGGAIAYGVTAALTGAPVTSVTVAQATLHHLSKIVTSLSFWEFIEAFTIGTIAVTLSVVSKEGGRR